VTTLSDHNGAMDRRAVEEWIEGYERLWRTPGTDGLADLFRPDATYQPSPWASPVDGLEAIARFWDEERDAADEAFDLSAEVVAVDGDTAVVRVSVDYGRANAGRWRDLWVIGFAEDGRCSSFEEWPFAPGQPDGH
jgi:ketosteroid isomerase-like protein